MIKIRTLFIVKIIFILTSCAISPVQVGLENFSYHNRARLQFITLGMTKDEVLKAMDSNVKAKMKDGRILSNPYKTEAMVSLEGTTVEILYYYTEMLSIDDVNSKGLTPVVLSKGKVTGWGKKYLESLTGN
ncbi:MAG: DUF3192 domain-containing protein [Candidatus Neomarinimicrobiota bacterium]|jgi:hypothetical protein|nr:DUF3192 domain-containing protein [Candidatus Neomarinimicrobiota bacterium]|tara:strand:+ start:2694 stop:3086 length:393 start_codon:yes stop_codon:yes gene_type:complete